MNNIDKDRKKLAFAFKTVRDELRLSQKCFGAMFFITQIDVSNIERGVSGYANTTQIAEVIHDGLLEHPECDSEKILDVFHRVHTVYNEVSDEDADMMFDTDVFTVDRNVPTLKDAFIQVRARYNLSQYQLSSILNISRSLVSYIENGKMTKPTGIYKKIRALVSDDLSSNSLTKNVARYILAYVGIDICDTTPLDRILKASIVSDKICEIYANEGINSSGLKDLLSCLPDNEFTRIRRNVMREIVDNMIRFEALVALHNAMKDDEIKDD